MGPYREPLHIDIKGIPTTDSSSSSSSSRGEEMGGREERNGRIVTVRVNE